MGNVLGWFGLKKPPSTPKAVRREWSPPPRPPSWKPQETERQAKIDIASPTVHQSTLQVTIQPKPKDEEPPKRETGVPPKVETPAAVSKIPVPTPEPSRQQEQQPSQVTSSCLFELPEDFSKQADINVQSLVDIAKEDVRTVTENVTKTVADSSESLIKVISSPSSIKSSPEESKPSPESAFVATTTTSPKEESFESVSRNATEVPKKDDSFELIVVCPPCGEGSPDIPIMVLDEIECKTDDSQDDTLNQDTVEEAVVKIQAGIRGYLTRKALKDRFSPAPGAVSEDEAHADLHLETSIYEIERAIHNAPTVEVKESLSKIESFTSKEQAKPISEPEAGKAQEKSVRDEILETTIQAVTAVPTSSLPDNQKQVEDRILVESEPVKKEEIPMKSAEAVTEVEASAKPPETARTAEPVKPEPVKKEEESIKTTETVTKVEVSVKPPEAAKPKPAEPVQPEPAKKEEIPTKQTETARKGDTPGKSTEANRRKPNEPRNQVGAKGSPQSTPPSPPHPSQSHQKTQQKGPSKPGHAAQGKKGKIVPAQEEEEEEDEEEEDDEPTPPASPAAKTKKHAPRPPGARHGGHGRKH